MSDFLTHEEVTQLLQGGCPELEASYQFTKNQIAELEGLRQKVAEQAAWIEKLKNCYAQLSGEMYRDVARADVAAIWKAATSDSKQILAEWLDAQLGEPVAWEYCDEYGVIGISKLDPKHHGYVGSVEAIPLFKKPGVLK